MAHKKQKKQGKDTTSREVIIAAAGDMIGRVLSHLTADGVARLTPTIIKDALTGGGGDAASALLRGLHGRGGQDLHDLHRATGLNLTQLLGALRDAREFGLVEADEAGDSFSLTRKGRRLAERLARAELPAKAARLVDRS